MLFVKTVYPQVVFKIQLGRIGVLVSSALMILAISGDKRAPPVAVLYCVVFLCVVWQAMHTCELGGDPSAC